MPDRLNSLEFYKLTSLAAISDFTKSEGDDMFIADCARANAGLLFKKASVDITDPKIAVT